MRRGKRTRSIGLLLGATLLLASCAAESPYAYAPSYDCAGCYGFYDGDFDGRFHNHYYYYHGTPDHGFGHGGGHGGGRR